jgi:hypothetical protein
MVGGMRTSVIVTIGVEDLLAKKPGLPKPATAAGSISFYGRATSQLGGCRIGSVRSPA